MPKVLRIINRFNLGGPTFNVAYLTKFLEPHYQTMLVGGMKDETEDSSEFIVNKLGLNPIIIPEMKRSISPLNDRIAYKKIKQIIREYKPDIVHTHASKAGAIGRLAAKNCNVPIIVHTFHGHVFHSYFGSLKTNFYKSIERYLAKKSTKIIAISKRQQQEICLEHSIVELQKSIVIPLGFDLSRFRENQTIKRQDFRSKYGLAADEIAIGIIGRLVPIKNHSMFLSAFKKSLTNTDKNIRAVIIGDGELSDQIKNEATSLGLKIGNNKDADITFTSWIRDIDVAYAGLDIVCLTSMNEGTPVSLIEAQAAGKPIISTEVGGIEDVVMENKSALLTDTNDIDKFADHLSCLIEDKEKRENFGTSGWNYVERKYHYLTLVENMKNLYDSLLESP